jgi:alkanesulfonate monooxygenase SsuD/methylene tetrahydromethanopterin reductase-like flavin-dependent oxidoreductase (luciferase family)
VVARPELHVGLILALTIRGLAVTSYDDMRRVAGRAEELGFDSVWLCDHFLTLTPDAYGEDAGIGSTGPGGTRAPARSMPLLECWTTLSALARDTSRSASARACCATRIACPRSSPRWAPRST